ncbi:MAG: dihydropteroate synthase [Trueperaceae bacterium]
MTTWPHRRHALRWHRPVPGATRDDAGYVVGWSGCAVMAVVNVTPDSFSDGGRFVAPTDAAAGADATERVDVAAAVAVARRAFADGALMLDIGGASTRPGAPSVPPEVEAARVVPVVRALSAAEPHALISVDTSDPNVAREAIAAGAHLVNDVRTLRDPALRVACASLGVPAVASHLRGEPATMQAAPSFEDVVAEVGAELSSARTAALADGMPDVVLDPGIGFGKTADHHRALLRATGALAALGAPLLVGASRKRFLADVTGEPVAARRDPASIAVHLEAAARGAALVRAHDVAGHVQALRAKGWIDG